MQEEKKEQSPKLFKKANSESALVVAAKDEVDKKKKEDLRKSLHKSGSAPAGLEYAAAYAILYDSPCGSGSRIYCIMDDAPHQKNNTSYDNQHQDFFP